MHDVSHSPGHAAALRERFSTNAAGVWKRALAETKEAGQFYLGVEHLFLGIAGECPRLLDQALCEVCAAPSPALPRLTGAVRRAMGTGPTPNWEKIRLTPRLRTVLELADALSHRAGQGAIEPLHLLAAIFEEGSGLPVRVLAEEGVEPTALRAVLCRRCSPARDTPCRSGTPCLDRISRDLVEAARRGEFDPLIGRERELELLMEVLCRRAKNNPVLLGEAGVGKTAIVEGLARRIAEGMVPPQLHQTRLLALSAQRLIAGGPGSENDVLELIAELRRSPEITVFVDEMHTLAGGEGVDAAALLKPPLARGEIRCIGATTTAEYRRFIEGESALERRFQPILVEEPGKALLLDILKGLRERYERHHAVTIPDDALIACISLSNQYIRDRQQPDKAIDLMDQSSARVAIRASGSFVNRPAVDQGMEGTCLLPGVVTPTDIAGVVSDLVGVPVPLAAGHDPGRMRMLESFLNARVLGQEEAVASVAQVIRMAKRELDLRPFRPDGVILLAGPGGVGKGTLAQSVASFLHGESPDAVIRFDMSEFSEPHTLARLVGPPPGYVGYEEEGQLTGRIRTHPDSVLLLDDIDRAHPSVRALFLQVFDEGRLTDSRGRSIHFDHTTIILTTQLGCAMDDAPMGFGGGRSDLRRQRVIPVLEEGLGSEFLSRMDRVIVMKPLDRSVIVQIARNMLDHVGSRLAEDRKRFVVHPGVAEALADHRFNPSHGARHLARAVEDLVIDPLSTLYYQPDWDLAPGAAVHVAAGEIQLNLLPPE